MRFKIATIILTVLFTVTGLGYSRADWVDDWINQSVVTGADNFATQKRNYATFGGAAARWPINNDPLISISKPRFKAGCGGIDAYMGGFSFMNFDYLVKKLQRIMGPAAAAFAFDMALDTLCSQCSKAIKAFEAIVDRLNGLQIDDCQASRVVATTLVDTIKNPGAMSSEVSNMWAEFSQKSGAEGLWQKIKEFSDDTTADSPKNLSGATNKDVIQSCPQVIQDAFFQDGSLLDNLSSKRGYPAEYVELMRGLIGDIKIQNRLEHTFVPPCVENNKITEIAEAVYKGEVHKKNAAGVCSPLGNITINGASYNSYRDYVRTMIAGIATAMIQKTALTPAQQNFLINTQGDVYRGLKAYVMNMGQNASPTDAAILFERPAGRYYMYAMFRDFYQYMEDILLYAESLSARHQGSATGQNQKSCQIEILEPTIKELQAMHNRAKDLMKLAYKSYVGETKILLTQQSLSEAISRSQKHGLRIIKESLR